MPVQIIVLFLATHKRHVGGYVVGESVGSWLEIVPYCSALVPQMLQCACGVAILGLDE
ncbi:MAG: hypothetical protein OXE93_01860 [bacterium]|nr:hypothetical protein [bacterium]